VSAGGDRQIDGYIMGKRKTDKYIHRWRRRDTGLKRD